MISHEKYELTVMLLHLIMQVDELKEYVDEEHCILPTKLLETINGLQCLAKQYIKDDILSS